MMKFTFRSDQLGSEVAMAWKDTRTGERGVLFRFPAAWYDKVLSIMNEKQEEVNRSYNHYKSWGDRMTERLQQKS